MRSRIGLKALGLCALVVGMMAISAGAAQASEWKVNGEFIKLHPTLLVVLGAKAENEKDFRLLTTVSGLKIEILCTKIAFISIHLVSPDTTTSGKVKFEGCEIFKEGPPLEKLACTRVGSPGAANGTIETTEGKGKLEKHETGQPVVLVLPNNVEKRFATIETAGCGLPELIPVFGELTLQDCENKGAEEKVEHLVNELKALSKVFVISNTEEHKAVLDGSALVFLTGEHANKTFSGQP